MKLMNVLYSKDFAYARIIIYAMLFVFYILIANFLHIDCPGCILCGMTRALKSLLKFDFTSAFAYNKNVWIFTLIIPIILIDTLLIIKKTYKH